MEIESDCRLSTHFPVTHKSISLDIKGNKTDIVICKYDDNFLVMVTQIGCMGTILHASSCGSSWSLLLPIGLKDRSLETLKDVISAVVENRLW
uniref:Uncharacterized protein LOC109506396 n=2 Tax=Elaeis guineensis var. tenera TaxID=51953 RepID=A0A8N4F242_ELAGV|nr:uncharacterized protein LOC109506396 [Elaeis guineensis]